jgi:hypothetical protein
MTTAQAEHTYRFTPDLGSLEHRLLTLARDLSGVPNPSLYVDDLASQAFSLIEVSKGESEKEIRWALSLSVLADIAAAGGQISRQDSVLQVSWPDWSTKSGEDALRSALVRLRQETTRVDIPEPVLNILPGTMSAEKVWDLLAHGQFSLLDASETHPSGTPYREIFLGARRYWSMPQRDREGRSKRFILVVSHISLKHPLPVGILEVGDGAPHDPGRDEFLGLTTESFYSWLKNGDSAGRLRQIEGRFSQLRNAILPIEGLSGLADEDLYARYRELERRAAGRSKGEGSVTAQKRLIYLTRIVRGRVALASLANGGNADPRDLYATVRLLRDLIVPRVHLEVTICGSLPPFSVGLCGKLVTAYSGDPRIVAICRRAPGQILKEVFPPEALSAFLPDSGAVVLTTKGLFASHSAQYSRAELPSHSPGSRIRLNRIGFTSGMTASLISRRTYQLSQMLLLQKPGSATVSSVFGSGGSKRQRRIEAAVRLLGLPDSIIHPRIKRPAYAASLVSNPRDVVLLNSAPQWLVPTEVEDYAGAATATWRERWARSAKDRLQNSGRLVGVRELLTMRQATDDPR